MVAQDVGEVVMGWVGCEEGEGKEGKRERVRVSFLTFVGPISNGVETNDNFLILLSYVINKTCVITFYTSIVTSCT